MWPTGMCDVYVQSSMTMSLGTGVLTVSSDFGVFSDFEVLMIPYQFLLLP